MSTLLACWLLAQTGQIRATDTEVGGAADVRGYRRGVDAIVYDPAAPAFADGFEFQYRQRFADDQRSSYGIQAVLPGALSLAAGYDWFAGEDLWFERATFNLAVKTRSLSLGPLALGPVALGTSYQRYRTVRGGLDDSGAWNVGLFAEPASWLSLSLGVDAINSPVILGERQAFAYRVGGSLRPLNGAPWLTVGAETRLDGDEYDWGRTRAVLDIALRSLHGFAAYDFNREEIWFGISFGQGGADARLSGGVPTDDELADDTRGALALTLRQEPVDEPLIEPTTSVEVTLSGDLRRDGGFFVGKESVSPVAYQLKRLAERDSVKTVVLTLRELSVGAADIASLRDAIGTLKSAGKKVVAEIGSVGDRGYMIAAAADQIRVDPSAILEVNGFAVTRRFFADTLAKVGVRFTAVGIGDYKTGPDPLTRNAPRPESDEVTGEILDEAYSSLLAVLQADRGMSAEEARAVVDRGIFTSQGAIEAGLADELIYPLDPSVVPEPRRRGRPLRQMTKPAVRWGPVPTIAVIPVVGTISGGAGTPLPGEAASPKRIVPQLERAMRDPSVKAAVLYVDSPGGGVGASEAIWRAIKRLAAKKPVITCMGNIAASGGYWVATATDAIIAQPGTITGSIGIFQLKLDIERLYDMLELNAVVDKRGELADIRAETRGLEEDERARVRMVMEQEYGRFVGKVAQARDLDVDRVRELGGGRVYTGRRALELGLVDELGGLPDAVALAASRAELESGEYRITIPTSGSSFGRVLRSISVRSDRFDVFQAVQSSIDRLRALDGKIFAILPTTYEVEW